ncbi:hypothetical protein JHW43_007015 [Diplocarpon mali]|nr:hypothetical protein JHW43_007015 [Diplocarpon mali]
MPKRIVPGSLSGKTTGKEQGQIIITDARLDCLVLLRIQDHQRSGQGMMLCSDQAPTTGRNSGPYPYTRESGLAAAQANVEIDWTSPLHGRLYEYLYEYRYLDTMYKMCHSYQHHDILPPTCIFAMESRRPLLESRSLHRTSISLGRRRGRSCRCDTSLPFPNLNLDFNLGLDLGLHASEKRPPVDEVLSRVLMATRATKVPSGYNDALGRASSTQTHATPTNAGLATSSGTHGHPDSHEHPPARVPYLQHNLDGAGMVGENSMLQTKPRYQARHRVDFQIPNDVPAFSSVQHGNYLSVAPGRSSSVARVPTPAAEASCNSSMYSQQPAMTWGSGGFLEPVPGHDQLPVSTPASNQGHAAEMAGMTNQAGISNVIHTMPNPPTHPARIPVTSEPVQLELPLPISRLATGFKDDISAFGNGLIFTFPGLEYEPKLGLCSFIRNPYYNSPLERPADMPYHIWVQGRDILIKKIHQIRHLHPLYGNSDIRFRLFDIGELKAIIEYRSVYGKSGQLLSFRDMAFELCKNICWSFDLETCERINEVLLNSEIDPGYYGTLSEKIPRFWNEEQNRWETVYMKVYPTGPDQRNHSYHFDHSQRWLYSIANPKLKDTLDTYWKQFREREGLSHPWLDL